jgi:hypothetical protein
VRFDTLRYRSSIADFHLKRADTGDLLALKDVEQTLDG